MGKIFHSPFNFPQNRVLLVSYFGYICDMMSMVFFYQSIKCDLRDFPGQIIMEIHYEITDCR